ncbi:MAG: hypothetical protein FJ100_11275 [Deltaproteobacteria bacterium]|nr:hypothetical protein [Deltaproteobacteria bacterium]
MDWPRIAIRLANGTLPPVELKALRSKLRAGPWLWPLPTAPELAQCQDIAQTAEVSPNASVLLASFGANRCDLWVFPAPVGAALATATLAPNARRALRDALTAVARTVPTPAAIAVQHAFKDVLAGHLASHGAAGSAGVAPDSLSGHSFGLAFAIAATACATRVHPRPDTLAIAELTDSGEVIGAALEGKLDLLARTTRRIVRVLVARDSEVQARQLLDAAGRPDIAVLGVTSLPIALAEAFDGDVVRDQLAAEHDPVRRARILRRFWHLVRTGRHVVQDWAQVADLLERTRSAWTNLPDGEAAELEFLHSIAGRHAGRAIRQLPSPQRLEHLPDSYRADVLANWIQNASDGGAIDAAIVAEAAALTHGAMNRDGAKLAGALGRYRQLRFGEEPQALELLQRATSLWWREQDFDNLSLPLSAALRLAGALRDRTAFEGLASLAREVIEDQLVADPSYLQLALGTGLALLGEWPLADAALETPSHGTGHVGASALRWRMRCARSLGRPTDALQRALVGLPPAVGTWFVALAELDCALVEGRDPGPALRGVLACQPALQGLAAVCAGVAVDAQAERVARFFPY